MAYDSAGTDLTVQAHALQQQRRPARLYDASGSLALRISGKG